MNTVSIESLRKHVELREDGTLWWKISRQKRPKGGRAFATKKGPGNKYLGGMFDGVMLLAHRVVWALTHDEWPTGWLDHIDGDTTNNRPDNLRPASPMLSNHNRRFQSTPVKYLGVVFFRGAYVAQIQHNKQHYYLGRFQCAEEAARARDAKAKELYGEDANLNFPEKF
jgi:hypothetical protein